MTIDLKLSGKITVVTPIHITRPDMTKEEKGTPMLKVVVHEGTQDLPYIPGETLKGRLRSLSSDIVAGVTKQPLSLDMFWGLYKGGIKNDDKEPTADLKKIVELRHSNPVIGLYGAAVPRWLGGSLSVEHAMPQLADHVAIQTDTYMRIDDFKTYPERVLGLPEASVKEYLSYDVGKKERTALNAEDKKLSNEVSRLLKKDPKPQDEIDGIQAQRMALKAKIDAIPIGNTIGRPLEPRNAIATGSFFSHQIRVIAGTDVEVGLLLATLKELSRNCRIGGLRSVGHGYFRAEYSILVREGAGEDYRDAGSMLVAPDEFSLTTGDATVERAMAAWSAKVADPSSLMLKAA